ncbi:MAG: hypothetical protein IPH98_01150 [Saprospiraceae bacterium]|nr:hypothetical protein [Candidatus Defluviibacterium haderslevense]
MLTPEIINNIIERFKVDLGNSLVNETSIVRKYLLHGSPLIFQDNEDLYFNLKNQIANFFDISTSKIIMVGSSKLGFSIAPDKLWKHTEETSDIDMVVISDVVFDFFWKDLLDFNINVVARTIKEDADFREFLEYFLKGWIRPDKFPFKYAVKDKWFEYFKSISYNKYKKRKITVAVFRNEYFFEKYHTLNIKKIRLGL